MTAVGLEGTGVGTYYDAELEMSESMASGSAGISLEDGDYAVRRSRLSGSRCGLCGLDLGGQRSAIVVENSLVTLSAPASADGASALSAVSSGPGGNVAVTARGSTFVAGGENPGAAVSVGDLSGVGTATVELVGSIAQLQGRRAPGEADLVADREQITASRSSFATRAISNGGSATEPGSATNVGDPALGPDFSLLPGSPAIDSGDQALGGVDLAGAPRSQDGDGDGLAAPDMSAFELAPPGAGANVRPVVRRFRIARKLLGPKHRRTRFRFKLSEAARVTIRIERRVRAKGGKLRFKRVRTLKSSEAAGAQSVRFRARASQPLPRAHPRHRCAGRALGQEGSQVPHYRPALAAASRGIGSNCGCGLAARGA
ncbi:MAG: choice-of-anchor Q domain-containing protein [Thermoleophilaceae bacterium]